MELQWISGQAPIFSGSSVGWGHPPRHFYIILRRITNWQRECSVLVLASCERAPAAALGCWLQEKKRKKERKTGCRPILKWHRDKKLNAENAWNVSAVKSTVQRPQRDLVLQMASVRKDNYSSGGANPGSVDPTLNRAGWARDRV